MCTSVVFSSLSFLYIFLPICLLGAFALPKLQWKNYFLLAMSLFFYAWGEPKWILLMIISTAVEYAGALVVDRNRGTWKAKAAVGVSVGVALTFLFIFKYLDFFTFNFNTIFHTNAKLLELTLPIGISFYTFQTITYIVDVYRDKAPVQKNFAYLLLYVSMFPQLIAGPIVKYVDIEAQIRHRTLHGKDVGEGVLRFLTGLFKKAILANVAGEVASTFLDGNLSNLSLLGAWLGILSYTLQIYFDFSAYSDMAIGLGRIFGFRYKENFNYPYIANSITDFWRRWHISLTTFFREYLYIPLGGNRKHQVLNLFIVWALTGFWHGASWNFIAWGLYYFVLILAEKLFLGKALESIPRVFGHIYTLLLVVLGWGLFYFDDMSRLRQFFSVLFGFGASAGATAGDVSILLNHLLFFLFAIVACLPVSRTIRERYIAFGRSSVPNSKLADAGLVVFAVVLLFLDTAAIVGSTYNPFLYFRF